MRATATMILLVLAGFGGFYVRSVFDAPAGRATDPVTHHAVNTPTIGQVQKLASLVALRVPISDVRVSELEGLTGGVKLAMAVHGDVEVATDLSAAKFSKIDADHRTAVLTLPEPVPQRPRLDHEHTRVLEIDRSGLWRWVGEEAGESTLVNRAMKDAQRVLQAAADRQDLRKQACEQAQRVICSFFGATGWQVNVEWKSEVRSQ